jgi:hypothetical protein
VLDHIDRNDKIQTAGNCRRIVDKTTLQVRLPIMTRHVGKRRINAGAIGAGPAT